MKEKMKHCLSKMFFAGYHQGIFHNKIRVSTIVETVQKLLESEDSLVRLGDGEIKLISGKGIPFQKPDALLCERLKEIIRYQEKGLLVALPDVFRDVSAYIPGSQKFWMEHMLFHRKDYLRFCDCDKTYENAFFSRPYIMYRDRSGCRDLFEQMKKIWQGKQIVFVEGEISHNGVDVDLFDSAASIERIICPSEQAWNSYPEILRECRKQPKEKLILVSLGAAGKVLTLDLHRDGYRVLDIGSLDMEYGWFLEGAAVKCRVPKHEISTREENEEAGYYEYLSQIISNVR